MNRKLITLILFALIATTCVGLNKKKKQVIKLFVQDETEPQNFSLQRLLDLQIPESIDCSDSQKYEQISKRMNSFVSFFKNNPVQKLDNSINALSEVSILLKKAKSMLEKNLKDFGFLQEKAEALIQKLKNDPKAKQHQKLQSLLGDVDNVVNPEKFADIKALYQQAYTPDSSEQDIVQKLQKVIDLIKELNQELTEFKNDSQNFDGYSTQLQEKIQQVDDAIATCV